ncbi:MAG: hypothetical protein PUD51_12090 [Prevotellaceae bacterium]|nr:hypothetical protein [Prevotellaceae bacterium]
MNKKQYTKPQMEVHEFTPARLICTSSSDNLIISDEEVIYIGD